VPAPLQKKLLEHVEKNFAQTRGIDVEGIASGLPTHLQVPPHTPFPPRAAPLSPLLSHPTSHHPLYRTAAQLEHSIA
jgi:hypothetical protein